MQLGCALRVVCFGCYAPLAKGQAARERRCPEISPPQVLPFAFRFGIRNPPETMVRTFRVWRVPGRRQIVCRNKAYIIASHCFVRARYENVHFGSTASAGPYGSVAGTCQRMKRETVAPRQSARLWLLATLLALAAPHPALAGLHIRTVFVGGASPPPEAIAGGGNLQDIFQVAAEA